MAADSHEYDLTAEQGAVPSPCIRVCALDSHDVCRGCGRTRHEIAVWSRVSPLEQTHIVAQAKSRLPRD